MTHDPLCPYFPERQGFGGIDSGVPSTQPYIAGVPCQCDLIARVREDERAATFRDVIQAVHQTFDDVTKAIEGLSAIPVVSADQPRNGSE